MCSILFILDILELISIETVDIVVSNISLTECNKSDLEVPITEWFCFKVDSHYLVINKFKKSLAF